MVAVDHPSADDPSSGGRVRASTVAAASTGSSTGNVPASATRTTRTCRRRSAKNPPTRRVIAPLVGAFARARRRASEPSCKDDFGRERPPLGDGWCCTWCCTRCCTTPLAEPRQRLKRGGRSRPFPLRWRGSGRPAQDEKPEQKQRKMEGWCVTPPSLFLLHPPLCRCHISRGPHRDPHRDPGTVQPIGKPTSPESADRRARRGADAVVRRCDVDPIQYDRHGFGRHADPRTRSSKSRAPRRRPASQAARARLLHSRAGPCG